MNDTTTLFDNMRLIHDVNLDISRSDGVLSFLIGALKTVLSGKSVYLTGNLTLDLVEMEATLIEFGCTLLTEVNQQCDFIICGESTDDSILSLAKSMNVTVIKDYELFDMVTMKKSPRRDKNVLNIKPRQVLVANDQVQMSGIKNVMTSLNLS